MRIAIIGSGIAGNAAAWALTTQRNRGTPADVTVYEAASRPGGHSCTVDIDYDGRIIAVDIGFIVYNTLNYPDLVALFEHLGVETKESDMSFSVSMGNGALEWSGKSLDTLFAQRRNLFSLSFWRMIRDILRFNKTAEADLKAGRLGNLTLRDYLWDNRFGRPFANNYLAPMGAAIWSTPHAEILDFPAESFLSFFSNHRLMHPRRERPKWRTVAGGSRTYVEKMTAPYERNIRLDSKVTSVARKGGKVHVSDINGMTEIYDHAIFASHTDQTLAMLSDASETERGLLSAIEYRANDVYLHRDPALMPKNRKVWSSWNYIETPDDLQEKTGVCVSYYMNALQKIDPSCPVFVSLNPQTPPREELTFHATQFEHPQFSRTSLDAQRRLPEIQGAGNVWYCGAWCGHGFHEDGLKAGFQIAERLGARIPWHKYGDMPLSYLEAAE